MNWRAMAFSALLAAGLALTAVPSAQAKHWKNRHYGDDRYGASYAQCGEIVDRIRHDRAKMAEIGPTGRHRKALGWFENDLHDAYRDLDECRAGGSYAGYDDPYYDRDGYDPYYGDQGSYGGYDTLYDYDGDGRFKWKNDWPALVGLLLNTQAQ
jgi:hypothetical protein